MNYFVVLLGENRAGRAEISHIVQLQLKDNAPRPPPHPTAAAEVETTETNGTNGTDGTDGVADDPNLPPKGRKKGKGERESSVASSTATVPLAQLLTARDSNWVSRYHEAPVDPKSKLHFAAFLSDRTIAEGGKTKLSAYVEGYVVCFFFHHSIDRNDSKKFNKNEILFSSSIIISVVGFHIRKVNYTQH